MRIANIGPMERRKRLGVGVVAFLVSAVFAGVLIAGGVGRAWRLALFLPLSIAALGFFQSRDKT